MPADTFFTFKAPRGSTLLLTTEPGDGTAPSQIDILSTIENDEDAVLDGTAKQTPSTYAKTASKVLNAGYMIQVFTAVGKNATVKVKAKVTKPDGTTQHSKPVNLTFEGGDNGIDALWGLFIEEA